MTFDQAITEITAHFPMVEIDKGQAVSLQMEVCSGGVLAKPDDPVPLLCMSRELAIATWCDTMLQELGEIESLASFGFLDGPHCDQHTMTNQTARNQQRVVEPRFSVTATIGLFITPTTD